MAKTRGSARSKGRRKGARNDAAAIARAEHIATALELRRIGYTFREIATAMSGPKWDGGYGIGRRVPVPTAFRWVRDAIQAIPEEVAQDLRTMELQRLDELQVVLYQNVKLAVAAEAPPPTGAIEQILRIMDRRAKYLGLYIADDKHNAAVVAHGPGAMGLLQSVDSYTPVLRPDGPVPALPVL
jgi:hypothetical protein